jgi:hypothetical protein
MGVMAQHAKPLMAGNVAVELLNVACLDNPEGVLVVLFLRFHVPGVLVATQSVLVGVNSALIVFLVGSALIVFLVGCDVLLVVKENENFS